MNKFLFSVSITAVLWGLGNGSIHAEEPFVPVGQVSNAALAYWQAFAMLPQLSKAEMDLLKQVEQGAEPLDKAEGLLARGTTAMSLARNVEPQTACRWEVVENGPHTLLPHLSKARLLARLMVIQARVDAADGKSTEAVEQLTAALLVARNVDEGVLLQLLVGDAIESLTLDAAQPLLEKLNKSAVRQLSKALAQLPPRATFATAMVYERDVIARWLRPVMAGEKGEAGAKLQELLGESREGAPSAILAGNKEDRMRRFEEFRAEYDRVIETAKLPASRAEAEFARIEKDTEQSPNPLIRLLMPAADRAHQRHVALAARFELVEAAVRSAADGSNRGG